MLQPQILAQAIVDVGRFEAPFDQAPYLVTVWGELNGDKLPTLKYEIAAYNDDQAARAGLDRYVCDMARPI